MPWSPSFLGIKTKTSNFLLFTHFNVALCTLSVPITHHLCLFKPPHHLASEQHVLENGFKKGTAATTQTQHLLNPCVPPRSTATHTSTPESCACTAAASWPTGPGEAMRAVRVKTPRRQKNAQIPEDLGWIVSEEGGRRVFVRSLGSSF